MQQSEVELLIGRRRLGTRLRELRLQHQLSGAELADKTAFSQPKVSRIENGKVTATARDIDTIARALGVPSAERKDLVSQARYVEDINRSLRRARLEGGLERIQADHQMAESMYSHFLDFSIALLPGLVQTPDYARAVIRAALPSATRDDVAKAVARRIERQAILADETRSFVFLIDASVLTRRFGPRQEHIVQLNHLKALMERPNVSIETVGGDGREQPASVMHGFTIYDDHRVVVELMHSELFVAEPDAVESYRSLFDRLADGARRSDSAPRDVIERAIAALA